jgi:hypothetical protein
MNNIHPSHRNGHMHAFHIMMHALTLACLVVCLFGQTLDVHEVHEVTEAIILYIKQEWCMHGSLGGQGGSDSHDPDISSSSSCAVLCCAGTASCLAFWRHGTP